MNTVRLRGREERVVGRRAELEALASVVEAAARGEGSIALIMGEPGIGKTTLARACLRDARHLVPIVTTTECLRVEATQPFAPLTSLLHAFESRVPELARKVRASFDRGQAEGVAVRAQLLMNWINLIESAAERDPLIIAIDDLHWADEATLGLVAYIARKIERMRVLLLCTARLDEPTATPTFEQTRSDLQRRPNAVEVMLRPLTTDDTSGLVRSILALTDGPDREFVTRLHARADGNPLLIEEIVRALIEHHLVEVNDRRWIASDPRWDEVVPATVSTAVAARLRSMTVDVAADLRAAAILGPRFAFVALAELTRRPEHELLKALHAAVDAQLIEEDPRGDGTDYRFRHALIRDAIEGTLLGPERAALHAAAATLLEGRVSHAHLAYHYDEARRNELAAEHHLLAAVDANVASAFDAALRHSERALELVERPILPEQVMRLLPMWHHHANPSRALQFADRLLELYADEAHRLYRGRVLTFRGLTLDLTGRHNDARESCAAAVEVLEPLGDSGHLARALANQSFFTTHDDEAVLLAERAVSIGRRSGDIGAYVHATTTCGGRLIRIGRYNEGVSILDEAERVIRQPTIPRSAQLISLAVLNTNLRGAPGMRARRGAIRDEIISLGRAAELRTRPVVLAEDAAALERGDWDDCMRLRDELREFRGDASEKKADELRTLFMRVLREGPGATAPLVAREGPQEPFEPAPSLEAAGWSAATALAVGQYDRAVSAAGPALVAVTTDTQIDRDALIAVPAAIYGISAAREATDASAFASWTDAIRSAPRRTPLASLVISAFAEAERSIRQRDARSGLAQLLVCIERLDDLDEPLVARHVRLRRAQVLAEIGDHAGAQHELDGLVEYWRAARADWYLSRLRDQVRTLGLAVQLDREPRPARLGTTLTRREREVAALIAEGLTNKEIAARLDVSPRTAESHVEQIRTKLGFTSRAQIATWVTQQTRLG